MCCASRAHVSTTTDTLREGRTGVDANFEIPFGWLRNVSFASSPSKANGDESFCGSLDSTDMVTANTVSSRGCRHLGKFTSLHCTPVTVRMAVTDYN